jgi:hypothetical protein
MYLFQPEAIVPSANLPIKVFFLLKTGQIPLLLAVGK